MGGTKKKPIAKAEKARAIEEKKPEKKGKEAKVAQQIQKHNSLLMPRLDDKQISQIFRNMKAVTVYSTAKTLEVNASVASALLRSLEAKRLLMKVGGYSGHYVYRLP